MNASTKKKVIALVLLGAMTAPIRLAAQNQLERRGDAIQYVVKDLGTLGGTGGVAEGISDRSWVVGDANPPGDQSVHATLWREGVVTDLGTLGGINSQEQWPVKDNRGLIVGASEIATKDPFNEDFCGFDANAGLSPTGLACVGFLWQEGVMTALPTLGGNNAQALGVNNQGQVVGMAEQSTQDPNCVPPQVLDVQAVIWSPKIGEIQILPPLPGDISAWAIGINDRGQITGLSGGCFSPNFNAGGGTPQHGVVWQNGTATNIGTLGGSYIFPWAINSRGQVVGQSSTPGDTTIHSFLWQKGVMTDLGEIAGDFASIAFGLNDAGEVVGGSCDQNLNCRAFLWQDGVMTDINSLVKPGSTSLYLVFANDINSRGEIAFYAFDQSNGEYHAAMAIPCDEQHISAEGCEDRANETVIVSRTGEHPRVVLPQNVRQQLLKRMGLGRLGLGFGHSDSANGPGGDFLKEPLGIDFGSTANSCYPLGHYCTPGSSNQCCSHMCGMHSYCCDKPFRSEYCTSSYECCGGLCLNHKCTGP